jgi:hypothetical protein
MMSFMRTTLNISDALLEELKEKARIKKCPLNAIVEETLQRGLSAKPKAGKKISLPTFSVGIKPAYRGMSMNQLYDQIETEDFLKVAEP